MSCIFCDIVSGKLPCRKVGENNLALAFLDVNPASDGHTVIIPKKHFQNFADTPKEYLDAVCELAQQVAKAIEISELKPWGFNYLSNQGEVADQVVMHFHLHVIPKYGKNEGFQGKIGTRIIGDLDETLNKIKKVY